MPDKKIFWKGTLADMIDNDILDHGLYVNKPNTDGFIIGSRGRRKFYMWDPTPNGYYKIYVQDDNGRVTGARYVDANKTIVSVLRNTKNTSS